MTLKEWLEEERRKARRGSWTPRRGTQDWLASKLGVDQGLVSKWVRRASEPVTHGPRIVRLSGGKVTLVELRRME